MKNKVTVNVSNRQIHFYLMTSEYGKLYLFSRPFTKGIYEYFRRDRAEAELRSYHNWNRNPALDKVVTRLPAYIKYALSEAAESRLVALEREELWSYDREIA